MSLDQTPEIDGTQPAMVGERCEELVAMQYWHEGKLVERVNAVHLRLHGSWHRLVLDCGTVDWTAGLTAPARSRVNELRAEYIPDDLGLEHDLRGLTIDSVKVSATDSSTRVEIAFSGGRTLSIFETDDLVDYELD